MKTSESKLKAIRKYRQKVEKTYLLTLNKEHDQDIIQHLEKQASKNGYLKDLIRADIKKGG